MSSRGKAREGLPCPPCGSSSTTASALWPRFCPARSHFLVPLLLALSVPRSSFLPSLTPQSALACPAKPQPESDSVLPAAFLRPSVGCGWETHPAMPSALLVAQPLLGPGLLCSPCPRLVPACSPCSPSRGLAFRAPALPPAVRTDSRLCVLSPTLACWNKMGTCPPRQRELEFPCFVSLDSHAPSAAPGDVLHLSTGTAMNLTRFEKHVVQPFQLLRIRLLHSAGNGRLFSRLPILSSSALVQAPGTWHLAPDFLSLLPPSPHPSCCLRGHCKRPPWQPRIRARALTRR